MAYGIPLVLSLSKDARPIRKSRRLSPGFFAAVGFFAALRMTGALAVTLSAAKGLTSTEPVSLQPGGSTAYRLPAL